MARKKAEITQDYGNVCAQIGERIFQISIMEKDIEELKKKIIQLGDEMKAVDEEEKKNAPVQS